MRWTVHSAVTALSFLLLSSGITVAQAQCPALPNQLTNGQIADATQVMANFSALATCINTAPAGATNALQYNAGSGFGAVGPLTNGQLVIGSTGNAPQAATLTAGSGITITTGPGGITISGGSEGAYTPPKLVNFVAGNVPSGALAADTSTGLAMTYPSSVGYFHDFISWDSTAYAGSGTSQKLAVGIHASILESLR